MTSETPTRPCGGCGETRSERRCLGCMHDFGDDGSAWVRRAAAGGGDVPNRPTPAERFDCEHRPLPIFDLLAIDEGRPIEVLVRGEWLSLSSTYDADPLDVVGLTGDDVRYGWRWVAG